MQANEKELWFPAKKYGWGWGLPNCWQGWVMFATYLVSLCAGAFLLSKQPGLFSANAAVLSMVLMIVCYFKGEKPRWRWGKK
jgi:hypothetical protein